MPICPMPPRAQKPTAGRLTPPMASIPGASGSSTMPVKKHVRRGVQRSACDGSTTCCSTWGRHRSAWYLAPYQLTQLANAAVRAAPSDLWPDAGRAWDAAEPLTDKRQSLLVTMLVVAVLTPNHRWVHDLARCADVAESHRVTDLMQEQRTAPHSSAEARCVEVVLR